MFLVGTEFWLSLLIFLSINNDLHTCADQYKDQGSIYDDIFILILPLWNQYLIFISWDTPCSKGRSHIIASDARKPQDFSPKLSIQVTQLKSVLSFGSLAGKVSRLPKTFVIKFSYWLNWLSKRSQELSLYNLQRDVLLRWFRRRPPSTSSRVGGRWLLWLLSLRALQVSQLITLTSFQPSRLLVV